MVNTDFVEDNYYGHCSICGNYQNFVRIARSIRETYRCKTCKASLREREQAQSILSCFGHLNANTLTDLAANEGFKWLAVYEPGTIGPFRKVFRQLPNYHQSDYYADTDRSKATLEFPHQSLEELSYPDQYFDLIITSDILEHVRNPMRAFAETYRVLKSGGYHVFTIPLQDPIPPKTISRVDVSGDIDVPLLPEHYHGNGKGGRSLVYNDFGRDIIEMLSAVGFFAYLRRAIDGSTEANRVYTVIGKRL